ncbi:MAG: PEP/pyruvate-binding domain-containing protein, partial [Patescibacteria group bacterium]
MTYITPLSNYKFNLKAKKLEGLARLAQLKVPTVSNLFIVSSKLYEEFNETGKLPKAAKSELGKIFESIRKQGDTVTLRNSIYEEKNPGLAFSVHNTLNIKDYDLLEKKIIAGYRKAAREAINPKQIEFSFLLQSFYSSEKCGTLLSSNSVGHIYIQAIHGQHTTLLLRGDIEPDIYEVSDHNYKLVRSEIALKIHRMKKMSSGIRKVKVKPEKQREAVLNTDQIKRIAKLSQQVEKQFGPQEIEWAILDSGKIIFQETRDFKQSKKVKWSQKADVVFPNLVEGKVINL